MKKLDLKWTAGFFDGEGSVYIATAYASQGYTFSYRIVATIGQVGEKGKQICERLADTFEGNVYTLQHRKENCSQVHKWDISTKKLSNFLKRIYPYLELKKQQVELAMEFQEYTSAFLGKNKPSEAERIEKYSYYETAKQEMHFLNRKGV